MFIPWIPSLFLLWEKKFTTRKPSASTHHCSVKLPLIAAPHRNLGDVSVLVCLAHKLLPHHLAYNQTGELLLGWIPPLASQLTTFSGCLSPPKNRLIHITHPSAIENSTSRLTCIVHLEPGRTHFDL